MRALSHRNPLRYAVLGLLTLGLATATLGQTTISVKPGLISYAEGRRCCMIQLRREWGRFSNFSFRTPQRRISAYPARPSG